MTLPHGTFSVAKLGTCVHAHASSTATETVALRAILASIASLAVDLELVVGQCGRLQHLLAQATGEAHLVEFGSSGQHFLSGVYWLGALWALWCYDWLERHSLQIDLNLNANRNANKYELSLFQLLRKYPFNARRTAHRIQYFQ